MNALLHWLNAPEWSQVVKTLLHSLWQGALITMALVPTMRRLASPYARYRCSLVALAAIPVAGIITWAILNSFNHPPPLAPLPIATEATTPFDLIPLNQNPVTKLTVFAVHTPAPPQSRWTAWLALAWLLGAVAMVGRAGAKVAGAERLRRACQPLDHPQIAQLVSEARRAVGLARQIRVAVTDKLTSPAVVGVLVPTLILPLSLVTTLAPEQIRFILLHELAHIRRGDYFANLFQLFVEALLFFNPAIWWISHQVRREREACCDALAIELSGAPVDYARTLVHVAETVLSPTPASATAFGGDREPSSLADRIQRLLVPGYRPSLRLTWRAMIGAFVLGAALLVLSAEGTRVAVAQIAKSTGETKRSITPPQSEETLPLENTIELPNHFTNEFNLGESSAPGYVGPKTPAKLRDSPELERVKRNLKDLRFKLVSCSNKPLAEFFRELAEESQTIDPEGNGFRFSILPIRFNSSAATINPPLTNANLLEILAAIQGVPRLELAGISANGRLTLSPGVPSVTVDDGASPSKLEADRQKPHRSDNRSVQTNPLVVQVGPENLGGVTDWDVNVGNTLPLPALRLNRVTNVAAGDKMPFLGDLPWVGRLFASSPMKSTATDFVQLSQLSTLSEDIRSKHNITDSLSIRFQGTAAGNDLVFAQLPRNSAKLPASEKDNPPSQVEPVRRFSIGDLITVKFSDTIANIPQHEERIKRDGTITLPLIGAVTAADKTPVELQKEIHDRYVPEYYKRLTAIVAGEDRVSLVGGRVPVRQVYRGDTSPTKANQSSGDFEQYTNRRELGLTHADKPALEAGSKIATERQLAGDSLLHLSKTNPPLIESFVTNGQSQGGRDTFTGRTELTLGGNSASKIDPYNQIGMNSWTVDDQNMLYQQWFSYRAGDAAKQTPALATQPASTGVTLTSGNSTATVEFNLSPRPTQPAPVRTPIVLTNGNSTVVIDLYNSSGINSWTVDGQNQLYQQWFWYRVNETNAPGSDPKINVQTRFVEVSSSELETFMPDLHATMKPVNGQLWAGLLTKSQMNQALERMEMNNNIRLLSQGEVTTVSNRRAQVQEVEIKTIVTDINPKALMPPGITSTNKDGSGESLFITTTNLPFGTTIDVVPAITPDGHNVALTVIPRMTEFLGYDNIERPTNTVAVYENGKKRKVAYPLPRFRTQQMTNSAVVRDGMTLMLAFPPVQKTIASRDKVPVLGALPGVGRLFRSQSSQTRTNILFVLVTPTIVAPPTKQPDTSATNKDGDAESFVTSTNLRPVIDYLPVIDHFEPR